MGTDSHSMLRKCLAVNIPGKRGMRRAYTGFSDTPQGFPSRLSPPEARAPPRGLSRRPAPIAACVASNGHVRSPPPRVWSPRNRGSGNALTVCVSSGWESCLIAHRTYRNRSEYRIPVFVSSSPCFSGTGSRWYWGCSHCWWSIRYSC